MPVPLAPLSAASSSPTVAAAPAADAFRSSGQSPGAVASCALPTPFPLTHGGGLDDGVLSYERQGRRGGPVVVVLGGISAGRHLSSHAAAPAKGWWQDQVGAGLAIDTRRFDVLSFDWLGGRGASTTAGTAPLPFVDARDQANALWCLCDALGIGELHALIGCSYGGMVALHAAAAAPARVRRLGVACAAHRASAQASAWREVQRGIVALGRRRACEAEALALARALAMTTYRSPLELAARFAAPPEIVAGELRVAVAPWLRARGEDFARTFGAEQFLCLSRSIDAHVVDPATVTVPTSLLAFDSDQLVPPADIAELAALLPRVRSHRLVASPYGHDGFLKESAKVAAWLRGVVS